MGNSTFVVIQAKIYRRGSRAQHYCSPKMISAVAIGTCGNIIQVSSTLVENVEKAKVAVGINVCARGQDALGSPKCNDRGNFFLMNQGCDRGNCPTLKIVMWVSGCLL